MLVVKFEFKKNLFIGFGLGLSVCFVVVVFVVFDKFV